MAIRPSKSPKDAPSPLVASLIEAYLNEHGLKATSKSLTKELKSQKRDLSRTESDILKKNSLESILSTWKSSYSTTNPSSASESSAQESESASSASDTSVVESEDDGDSSKSSGSSSSASHKAKGNTKSRRKAQSSAPSTSSSSDSDADDEEEEVEVSALNVKSLRDQFKKPAVKAPTKAFPLPPPVSKQLKRKAADLHSESSSSASDSGSHSSSSGAESESNDRRPVKRMKQSDVNTNSIIFKPDDEPLSSKLDSDPESESESDSSSESESTSSSDSDSDVPMTSIAQPTSPKLADHADSSDESDDSTKPSEGYDKILVEETVIVKKEQFVVKDDDSAVASSSSGTVVGNTEPSLVTTVIKKKHEGARPTPLAALSAKAGGNDHVSNSYQSYEYADRAYKDLSVTRGKGFTKEKNKKKRGSYRGGAIDISGGKGFKFED